jgi:tRNA A-37 threonylcarbamoyl transferase component Bud32
MGNPAVDRERLAALFRATGHIDGLGDCSRMSITGPIYESAQTRLYVGRAQGDAGPKALIKVAINEVTGGPEVDFAREQFDLLVKASSARVDGMPLRVPQPYHFFADEAVVVQSWIEGESLDHVVGDRSVGFDRLCDLVQGVGEWLGRYHTAGGIESQPFDLKPMAIEIADAATSASREIKRAAHALAQTQERLSQRPQPMTRLHCDFKPSNMVANDEGIFGIDFHESALSCAYFDIAHFLNALTIDLLAAGRLLPLLKFARLEQAFLAGYEGVANKVARDALAYFVVYDLTRYAIQRDATSGLAGSAKSWLLKRLVAWRASSLMRVKV